MLGVRDYDWDGVWRSFCSPFSFLDLYCADSTTILRTHGFNVGPYYHFLWHSSDHHIGAGTTAYSDQEGRIQADGDVVILDRKKDLRGIHKLALCISSVTFSTMSKTIPKADRERYLELSAALWDEIPCETGSTKLWECYVVSNFFKRLPTSQPPSFTMISTLDPIGEKMYTCTCTLDISDAVFRAGDNTTGIFTHTDRTKAAARSVAGVKALDWLGRALRGPECPDPVQRAAEYTGVYVVAFVLSIITVMMIHLAPTTLAKVAGIGFFITVTIGYMFFVHFRTSTAIKTFKETGVVPE